MTDIKIVKPTKEDVRKWLYHEVEEHRPPPSQDEIRQQLGWRLIHANLIDDD